MIVVIGSASLRPGETGAPDAVGGRAAAIASTAVAAGATVQIVCKVGDDAAGDALVLALARAGIGHAAVLRDAGHPTPITAASSGGLDEDADTSGVDAEEPWADSVLAESMVEIGPDGSSYGPDVELVLPADPAERPRLEAADVDLALRYLTDLSVIVAAETLDPSWVPDAAAAPVAAAIAAGAAYAGAAVVAVVDAGGLVPDALAGATVLQAPATDPDGAFAAVVGGYAAALDSGVEPAAAFRAVVGGAGWEPTAV